MSLRVSLNGKHRVVLRWASIILFTTLTACSGGSSNDNAGTSQDNNQSGQNNNPNLIPEGGGIIRISDPSSPIFGAQVEIGTETLVNAEKITLTYEDNLPAPLPDEAVKAGAKQVSKVFVLNRDDSTDFGKSIAITVPFSVKDVPADQVPVVIYWDDTLKTYSPVAVRSIDRDKGMLTFITAHASKYVVMFIDLLKGNTAPDYKSLTTAISGFDPATDSFFIHNFGSYDSPGGSCFGMAAFSAWYQNAKKVPATTGLSALWKEGNLNQEEDDQVAREVVGRVYQAGNQKAHIQALNDVSAAKLTRQLADRRTALSVIQQFKLTRQAQIFAMGVAGLTGGFSQGHAVTVYAYDGDKQQFLYYDNNFPGEVVSVPWNWTDGFGKTSKNQGFDIFAFASFNSAYSSNFLNSVYQAAQNGFNSSFYPKISISTPVATLTNPNTMEVADENNVVIEGTVPRPSSAQNPNAQRYAHIYINGTWVAAADLDQVSNRFRYTLTKLPNLAGTDVMILVSENKKNWAGGFHAFRQFKIKVANQFFFQNMGFEAGNFNAWTSTRRTWSDPTEINPSDKSIVVSGISYDPIATDLPVPLFGKYAARVNNEDNNFHISTLTQTAVVPKTKNPTVRFYWSAVLEDPNHSPAEQPYVEIVVENKTKGIVLYTKRFYSNDPSYSGWKSYRNDKWRSIPWQLVDLPVAQYAGDQITIRVVAADCALGAHGGYAYLDVEE